MLHIWPKEDLELFIKQFGKYIYKWDFENNKWIRSKNWVEDYENFPVVLKCLHNSQDITIDFLREIELHTTIDSFNVTFCYDLPEPKNAVDDKDDDNSFEYSESIEAIDFTKLNLDKNS
ncbi:kinase-like domain-containing protein [Rhizophagus irregularis DAOM 181602=DAOM 197198]|nr:kinase-like domain-containing protein [Rhizophagus irregularis DAOM 181602=DAOM 197198]